MEFSNTVFSPTLQYRKQKCIYTTVQESIQEPNAPTDGFWGDQFKPCWFGHLTVAVPTSCWRDFSGKSLRNSQQDSTRVLSAHEAVMEITVLQCRHPHEHTPGVMSGEGTLLHLGLRGNGEAKPPLAQTVTGTKNTSKIKN